MGISRRKFLEAAVKTPLVVYGIGHSIGSNAGSQYTYSVNVTTTTQTGWEQDRFGNWLPKFWSGVSGNKIRLQSHTKAIQLANDIQAGYDADNAVAASYNTSKPPIHIVVVSHSGPNSDPTPNSDLEQIQFSPASIVLPATQTTQPTASTFIAPKQFINPDAPGANAWNLGLIFMGNAAFMTTFGAWGPAAGFGLVGFSIFMYGVYQHGPYTYPNPQSNSWDNTYDFNGFLPPGVPFFNIDTGGNVLDSNGLPVPTGGAYWSVPNPVAGGYVPNWQGYTSPAIIPDQSDNSAFGYGVGGGHPGVISMINYD